MHVTEKSISVKIKEAMRHGLIYGIGSISQRASGLILIPLYMRHLSSEEYGVFSLVQLIGVVSSALLFLGASSALPRFYFERESSDERRKVFNSTLQLLCLGALFQVLGGFFFSTYLSRLIIGSPAYSTLIFVMLIANSVAFINY